MATYYGTLTGKARTVASREGSHASGLKATVQSWDGSLIVSVRDNPNDDSNPLFTIEVDCDGSSTSGKEVFDGTLAELVERLA